MKYNFIINPDNREDFNLDLNSLTLKDLYIYVADIVDDSDYNVAICTNIEGDHRCIFVLEIAHGDIDTVLFDDLPQRLKDEVCTELLDGSGELKSQYLGPIKEYALDFATRDTKSNLEFFKSSSTTFKKYYKYPSYEKELHRLENLARNPEKLIKWK
jgi:hypothetical protein